METPEQYEASLAINPVRDSADAVARAFGALNERASWPFKRVIAVRSDSAGYEVTIDLRGRHQKEDVVRMLVKRNGAIYEFATTR